MSLQQKPRLVRPCSWAMAVVAVVRRSAALPQGGRHPASRGPAGPF